MTTKLFKELDIGQRFRLATHQRRELVKIKPIHREGSNSVRYNAKYVPPDAGYTHIGHGAKCLLPPYELGPKPPTKWAQLTPLVQAAGWRNIDELHSAMLAGAVAVPRKP